MKLSEDDLILLLGIIKAVRDNPVDVFDIHFGKTRLASQLRRHLIENMGNCYSEMKKAIRKIYKDVGLSEGDLKLTERDWMLLLGIIKAVRDNPIDLSDPRTALMRELNWFFSDVLEESYLNMKRTLERIYKLVVRA